MSRLARPSPADIAVLAETFRLLGDPTRLRILFFCLDAPRSVGDIAQSLELSQSLVSHHLRLLRGARLVRGQRRARQVFYHLADQHVSDMLADMAHHVAEEHAEK
ncbi:transcriptional regulator, ArsR family [Pseudogulbenkiania sp. NH8B]|uniref:ArsR/SmtB family transcription factor n=1 Tax=Pseudogulbenkiania sp. (strain NH8B) TaxID=748280 RepID=UPI0002279E29|nr:metalloregulator ArsR/SmtB family transcription factor [Pseudogulbenkiania sp. NH8B]BAK77760.1 transcriptional regulator, ArsR family [Pseudogulbenkiania sp. NH8B]